MIGEGRAPADRHDGLPAGARYAGVAYVGLVSDTHGPLRPQILDFFDGVDAIVHAGDIGDLGVLIELQALAPVTAVYGNADGPQIRDRVPAEGRLELGGRRLVVVHGDRFGTVPTPNVLRMAYPDADIIVYGHTHQPAVDEDTVLVVNPGAAGPARFGFRPSIAILALWPEKVEVQLIEL